MSKERKAYYFHRFIKKTFRYLLKPLSLIPGLVMMYVIFNFSGQEGPESAQLSRKVNQLLVLAYNKILGKGYDNASLNALIDYIHPYVRKGAHVTEYILLAMSIGLPLWVYRLRGIKLTLFAGIFCVGFAALDEYHQSFVAGRVADSHDVLIDSIGILIGIIIIRIVCSIGRKTVFSCLTLDDAPPQ